MLHLCCRPRFPQETKPGRLVTEISLADDFERDGTLQIDVECLVSDPHRTATQLDRIPVLTRHQFVVLKSLRWLFRCCRLDRILGNRSPAGLNPTDKTLAEQAHRTEFNCSRKLVTATQAGAFGLRFQSFLNTGFFSAVQVDLSFMIRCLLLVTKAARSPSFRNFVPKHYFSGYLC